VRYIVVAIEVSYPGVIGRCAGWLVGIRQAVGPFREVPVVVGVAALRRRLVVSRLVPLTLSWNKPLPVCISRNNVQGRIGSRAIERIGAVLSSSAVLQTRRLAVVEPVGEPRRVAP